MENEFYKKLKESNKFLDAYLVIKNLYSRNPADIELFNEFANLGLEIAMYDIDFDERKNFANEVHSALTIFCESADINEETLKIIKSISDRISKVLVKIYNDEKAVEEENLKNIQDENLKLLNQLSNLNQEMNNAENQEEFDQLLKKVSDIESKLNKDLFTTGQSESYDILTQVYSKTISEKMESLNNKRLLELNKKAVNDFKEVMDNFTSNKSRYKENEGNLRALVKSKLFIYDTRDLFNESLVYYNHVYSFIFNEVNENLKYKLTKWSIQTTKSR